jgi:hypothetical protein
VELSYLVPFTLSLLVTLAAQAQKVEAVPLPKDHPLLGTWRIDLPNNCSEECTLRADGSKSSSSGEERNEAVFEISADPLPSGFYRWTDKLVKSNGRPDCGGSVSKVGHVAVTFVRLHPSGKKFLLCEAESMTSCFAEFYRKGTDV